MAFFDSLGFQWNRDSVPREIPRASLERVVFRFRRMLPEYVWDAGVLEGNPFTFPEVKTLLEGVTIGGRKVSDQEQILNLAESSKELMDLVKRRTFVLDKPTFCSLHALVARNEALEWGHFRGEGPETQFTPSVALGDRGTFDPLVTEKGAGRLNDAFSKGLQTLQGEVLNPFERATAFFLFGSLQQFFFDGNKRTSRLMMNGLLMSKGIDAVSIPAARAAEFNSKMVDFYSTRDGTKMMGFVLDCHPSAAEIYQLNPGLTRIEDAARAPHFSLQDPLQQTSYDERLARRNMDVPHVREESERQQSVVDRKESSNPPPKRFSAEETRRKAREDWLANYYHKSNSPSQSGPEVGSSDTQTQKGSDFGHDHEPE
jgi:prophage maintenance system killer protein